MAATLSRIRFALRTGGAVDDITGAWADFDTSFGCIEDWSGILSEGPIAGDIIEQDWVPGAIWQRGPAKTFSFDVPFTALVSTPTNPNIWDSYSNGMAALKLYRGPLLTLRREFYDTVGTRVMREQAAGVLVTDLAMKVGIGRVLNTACVFQHLSGEWLEVSPA